MGAIKDLTDLTIRLLESKNARKFATEIGEIQSLVATIQSEQAAMWETNARLQTENFELKKKLAEMETAHSQELAALTGRQVLRAQLKHEGNAYHPNEGEIEGYGSGPWCTKCFETSGMLITLHRISTGGTATRTFYKSECPNCKSNAGAASG